MSPALYNSVYNLALFSGPLLIVWGWFCFIRRGHLRDRKSWLPLAALILATGSGLLAVGAMLYARALAGDPYSDPLFMRILALGLMLSLTAFAAGGLGAAYRNPLRWQAPAASLCMFLFWFLAASLQ